MVTDILDSINGIQIIYTLEQPIQIVLVHLHNVSLVSKYNPFSLMKHSSSGFSLAEIIVGVTILVMTAGSIVLSFSFLMDRELETKIALQNLSFHEYVSNLVHIGEIPETLAVGNTFYFTY